MDQSYGDGDESLQLTDYELEPLREDEEFILYRGRHLNRADTRSVLLLVPVSTHPALETLKKIEHLSSFRDDLDAVWAARPLTLSRYNDQPVLVLEDPGGEPLNRLIQGPMEVTEFLRLAIGLAAALRQLHKRELIHKDLKPHNVLADSAAGQVWLTGFGIASHLPRERQTPEPPEFIAGTLPYMAPEQTGRMNRSIDSRSDLYSLGVTLYEMLTGDLPFTASDPMEWVHCHIARHPPPPHKRVKSVPACVSAIVMKLLAKTPEERYQTASGVESDLRRFLSAWEAHRRSVDFIPGQHDVPDRLLIPEKLYGREREVDALLTAFDRVVAGGRPELVLVSGYSGIGKSAVVNELHKPLVPPRGLFATGKFDQYKRDIPYATLAQAFQSLTRPLLSKSEEELSKWRNALHEALDPNGQLMLGLVPELKSIIGEQPPVPELPQREAQARFHLVFRRFINVFARPEHPLALFLDDLQWLDAATLDLMEDLLTQPDVKHFLLIGAYRDNEVDPTHPLLRKVQAMRQAGALLRDIVLAPLAREDLEQLIADSLHSGPGHAGPLAELVHDKTGGNPFFSIQFISTLFEEGLLTFDHGQGRWSWDLNRIHAKGYADNVVDLMAAKLTQLGPETQNALKQLACLGNSAEFRMLHAVYQDSTEQMHAELAAAVGAAFILRSKDSYHFLHDRVQEAAYSLIPQELRAETHLRIGMAMASHTPPDKLQERIFEIVNQIDRGHHLITSIEERERVAELNLIAGRRAKTSTAYVSALKYLRAGRGLLTDETWIHNYDLIFSIEYLLAECELLSADMTNAENRLSKLAELAKTAHDTALVTRLRLTLYTALDRFDRAVEVFLEFLKARGTDWSPHPTDEEVGPEYERIWSLLGNRQIEELVDLPLITNRDVLDALDVFTEIVTPALFIDANFLSLVICRMVSLSLEHGNSDGSCYAYVCFSMVAGPRFGNYEAGFRFGKLGYDLVEEHGLHRYKARTFMSFEALITPWTRHPKIGRERVRLTGNAAKRSGDLTYAAYSCNALNTLLLAAGDPLAVVQREAETGLEFAASIRFVLVIDCITAQLGLIRTLRGLTPTFGVFNDERFDEVRFERHFASGPGLALPECWYWVRKVQAHFFAGDYSSAIEASLNAERLLWASPSFFEVAEYHFYSALSRAAAFDSATDDLPQRHFEALAAHQKQHEIWAQNCPENFENRAALIDAEIARIEGRVLDAEQLYETAIRSAHSNGFVNNEAIAYELAARFYATRGFQKIANAYLLEARYCYQSWGADGKVAQLDHLYPHLKKESLLSTPTSTILAPNELLDLATVIKVSQAVSGERVLGKLIDSLMRAAIEQAGAERGLLILPRGDQLLIEAEATTGGNDVTVHQGEDSVSGAGMPESLVRYVMRTQENVILGDASSQNQFSDDPYIGQSHARSVLALPLINQGKLISILYLENNLTPHIFTLDRLTVLKVLASQAAISLENTRLYRDLEDRERRIGRLIDSNIIGIVIWDLDGRLIDANDAFLRMVGYEREDLRAGLRWFDMTPPEWQEAHARYEAEELKATGMMQPREKEYFRKDGSRVPVLIGAACFEDQPDQGVAYILDLTEQKRAEEALRRSEANLAEAQSLSHTGSWRWNVTSGEVVWSQEYFAIFGFNPEKDNPSYQLYLDRIHPEDRSRIEEARRAAAKSEEDFEAEYRLLFPGGQIKHIHSTGHFSSGRSGETEYVGAVMDITERKQEELARRYSEEMHRVVAETASDAVVSTDESGLVLFANPATAKIFGYDPRELMGKPLTVLMPESMQKLHEIGFRRYLATGQRHINWQGTELTGLRKNGEEFPVEVSFGELSLNSRRVFTGFIRDISERKRAEEERERLRQAQADLARVNRVTTMGELTASLAHEIKQPIASGVTNAQTCLRLLRRAQPNVADAEAAASRLVQDMTRASEIISRIGSLFQKGVLQRELVDMNELIRGMIVLLQGEASTNSISIYSDLASGIPQIMVDRVQLQQVLMNLMLNGIEAMKGMRSSGKLKITSRQSADYQLLVSVADTGVGLSPEQAKQIFNIFFTSKPQGTGMGLPISRSIIESHGGRLWAAAPSGQGAVFQFTLPIEVSAR